MLSAELLDLLDEIGRSQRGIEAPLGGLRLVLVGDLLQLEPVRLTVRANW